MAVPTVEANLSTNVSVQPVTGHIGAEISGVDLAKPLSDAEYADIRKAYVEHGVIFFRDQELTPDEFVAFGQRFGRVTASKHTKTLADNPLVNVLERHPGDTQVNGEAWHSDQAYRSTPTFGTMLYAREVPDYGADTIYATAAPVYDLLSDGLKTTLETLNAVHSVAHMQAIQGHKSDTPLGDSDVAVHPVVSRHPETGRKTLFVTPGFTERFEGWTAEESAPLLNHIFEQVLQPEFMCRFRWEKNSIAFWDNRQVWHYATTDRNDIYRLMYRLVLD